MRAPRRTWVEAAKRRGRDKPSDKRLRNLLLSYGISESVIESLEEQAITPEIAHFLSKSDLEELGVLGDDYELFVKALGKVPKVTHTITEEEEQKLEALVNLPDLDEDFKNALGELSFDDDNDDISEAGVEEEQQRLSRTSIFARNERFDEEEGDGDSFEDEYDEAVPGMRPGGSGARRATVRAAGEGQRVDRNFNDIDGEVLEEIGDDERVLEELQKMGMIRKALPGLPKPRKIKIGRSEFVGSSKSIHGCPPPRFVEFAVIGRSNVGKSSLINAMTGNRKLADVSKQPGKTKSINHYLIDDNWYLVDLPGYGYAKVKKTERFGWHKATKQFFVERGTLAMVMLLIDSSIPPQQLDIDCAYWLGEANIPFMIIFTKTDKSKKDLPKPRENIQAFIRTLSRDWENFPPHVATSSTNGEGLPELLTYLSQVRELYKDEVKQGFWTQAREQTKKKANNRKPAASTNADKQKRRRRRGAPK